MTEFIQQLLNGLSLGAIYALIALGYTMVYGVLRFINFAHSDVFMVGAFIGYFVGEHLPHGTLLGGLVVLAASMGGCAVLGMLIERLVYRPLRGGPTLNVLITAIGMSLFLEYTGQLFFGATPRAFPRISPFASILRWRRTTSFSKYATANSTRASRCVSPPHSPQSTKGERRRNDRSNLR